MIEIPKLRDYQENLIDDLLWSTSKGNKGICAVSPTGSGKSKTMGRMVVDLVAQGRQCIIVAHRQELIKQLSLMLGEYRLPHQIVAPKSVVSESKHQHIMNLGRSFVDPFAGGVYVCAVQTLALNMHNLKHIKPHAIFADEFHHWTQGSYWGKVVENYQEQRPTMLYGFTASPERLDGKGLGVGHGGYCTDIVMGPYVDDLIESSYLSEYAAFVPPEPINVRETASGNLTKQAKEEFMATSSEKVMADALSHYSKHCPGQSMVVYCATVKASEMMAETFREAGYKSVAVNGKTPDSERSRAIQGLGNGETQVLCNAEILGEGIDVPSLTAVALCRPTQSLALHIQQIGRPLRPHASKKHAYIFDCVGNIQNLNHYPCTRREWSLEGKNGRKRDGDKLTIKTRTCPDCFATHHMKPVCPQCGHVYTSVEVEMQRIEMELRAITPEELKQMRDEARREQVQDTRMAQNAAIRNAKSDEDLYREDARLGLKPGATKHKQMAIEEKKAAVARREVALRYWKETILWGDVNLHDKLFAELFGVTERDIRAKGFGTVRINRLLDKMRVYLGELKKRAGGEYSPYEFDFIGLRDELSGGEGG